MAEVIAQHEDPLGEARNQILQAFAVAATVGEAGARWAAVNGQKRAEKADKLAAEARAAAEEQAEQVRVQREADRNLINRAFDETWLNRAGLVEVARLWRTATVHAAAGDPRARQAMTRAEKRLRQVRPGLMDAYDQYRAAGHAPAEAMHAAAHTVWRNANQPNPAAPRAHGNAPARPELIAGANGKALEPGGNNLDALDAAVREEVARLAERVSPEALDRLQRQWRSAGHAPAADAAGLLAQYARQAAADGVLPAVVADGLAASTGRDLIGHADAERRAATLQSGAQDVAATTVDEHDAGLDSSAVLHGAADHDAAGAAQRARMSRTFPPLTGVAQAARRQHPISAAANVPAQRRGRTR